MRRGDGEGIPLLREIWVSHQTVPHVQMSLEAELGPDMGVKVFRTSACEGKRVGLTCGAGPTGPCDPREDLAHKGPIRLALWGGLHGPAFLSH